MSIMMNTDHPCRKECMKILEEYGTPAHVIAHCEAVADTALRLGRALDDMGYRKPDGKQLDLGLIEAAGLLHDIARTHERHWDVAADMLCEKGLIKEAEIIRTHMHYPRFSDVSDINETDLVCLGDRLVIEDKYAGVEKRIEYIINKEMKKGRSVPREKLDSVKGEISRFTKALEEILGRDLEDICR